MRSIQFPNMFDRTVTNVVSDYDATLQNLRLLLLSEKGELFGDPYFGTGLRKYLFDQNDNVLRDILIDDIYSAIALFMPQIMIERKDITIEKTANGELTVTIKAVNRVDLTVNTYNIVLLRSEAF